MTPPRPANDADASPSEKEWLSVMEAAALVGRNPETIRRWIRDGRIQARRAGAGAPGGAQEVPHAEIIAMSKASRSDAQPHRPAAERSQVLVPGKQVVVLEDNTADVPDPLITKRRLDNAGQRWIAAIDDSVFAPPDAGFADRIRTIAAAAESEAIVMHEAARTPSLRWKSGTSRAIGLSYELRPGGNRPGPARSWDQFDQAVQQLADAQAGDDFGQIGDAFRQLSRIAIQLAGEIDDERATASSSPQADAG